MSSRMIRSIERTLKSEKERRDHHNIGVVLIHYDDAANYSPTCHALRALRAMRYAIHI